MRKAFLFTLIGLMALASCKPDKNEWSKVYGYTQEDIVGEYTNSNIDDAFDGLEEVEENHYCHLCDDATITITPSGSSNISLNIQCPEAGFSRTFQGNPAKMDDDFLIRMSSGYLYSGGRLRAYNLMAYVYRNEAQQIRLHGFASLDNYTLVYPIPDNPNADTIKSNSHTYYFDVIKN